MIVGDDEWKSVVKGAVRTKLTRDLMTGWKSIAGHLDLEYSEIAAIEERYSGKLEEQASWFLAECAKRAVEYEEFLAALEGTQHKAIANYLRSLFSSESKLQTEHVLGNLKNIDHSNKTAAVSLNFQHQDRTLSPNTINQKAEVQSIAQSQQTLG
eukprot:TRINITY_DN9919_c0_g7_i1.p1 TRINITY_DN9919_c0_g7~~TRINITY_DN9919_c0_g7_i1.p1  ORF type:complete len:155 (-),score=40.53 TRINITY_DN9919_c0_g7_i1:63-527(-)